MHKDKLKRFIGVDFGEKRIGLALADSETRLATPFSVVDGIAELVRTIEREKIDKAVIGLPNSMKGDNGGMSDKVKNFGRELENLSGVEVEYCDERLSSLAADSLPGSPKTKAPRDAVAAMLILQSYLDMQK